MLCACMMVDKHLHVSKLSENKCFYVLTFLVITLRLRQKYISYSLVTGQSIWSIAAMYSVALMVVVVQKR